MSDVLNETLLDRAGALGASTLHEAAGRIGALPSRIRPVDPRFRVCGPAYPLQGAAGDNLWLHRAVYAAPAGSVLVVSVNGGLEAGYWGEILNEAARSRGLGGLVIDGGVRDAAALAAQDFPVFSARICMRGTVKNEGAIGWLGEPVRLGEVVVHPGDLVVGDLDGVVVIPSAAAAAAVAAGRDREADEIEKIRRIRAGERTLDLYGLGEATLGPR